MKRIKALSLYVALLAATNMYPAEEGKRIYEDDSYKITIEKNIYPDGMHSYNKTINEKKKPYPNGSCYTTFLAATYKPTTSTEDPYKALFVECFEKKFLLKDINKDCSAEKAEVTFKELEREYDLLNQNK